MQNKTQLSTKDSCTATLGNNDTVSEKDRLVEAISKDPDLPALGNAISHVVQLSSSDDESIRQLTYLVLSDVSLTQKILRLSNSVTFRAVSGQAVTSISRAIFLLGFDTVKTCALAMILIDGMSGKHAHSVRTELTQALAASMVGRELTKYSHFKDTEEIAFAALFKNIGRLLIAAYDHNLYQEMMKLIENGSHTQEQASMQILGFSLDSFTETILQEWQVPTSIIQAVKAPPVGALKPPKTRQDWMQQAAEFSGLAALIILQPVESTEDLLDAKLLTRFGEALNLDKTIFNTLILDATEETNTLSNNVQLAPPLDTKKEISTDTNNTTEDTNSEEDLLSGMLLPADDSVSLQVTERHASGKPFNAHGLLLSGIQDVTEMMSSKQYKINDLFLLVLEILYNSLGFRFVTICLKDIKTNEFRSRYSLGENSSTIQQDFIFPTASSTDLFSLAIKRNVDLLISDSSTQKVHNMIPRWYRRLLSDAGSFIVLPLVVHDDKPIGLFYADRKQEAPEGISSDEMKLIRTLKGQILTALNSR